MSSPADIRAASTEERPSKWKAFFLKSWQPVPTWNSTIIIFFVIGIVLIAFGIVLAAVNSSIVEVQTQYDNQCAVPGAPCRISVTVPANMGSPVFVYYEIHNFYQNHRRYIKSRSTSQLAGSNLTPTQLTSDCDPAVTNSAAGKTVSMGGSLLNPNESAYPCGLIAISVFNDTFSFDNSSAKGYFINETGIAWPSDLTKFNNGPGNYSGYQWTDVTNEHFIVWMRTAGLPNFRKLWGRIDTTIPAGTYSINITNNYPVSTFSGAKYFVLSTTGPFGGKNLFLEIAYFVVGGVCLLVAGFFLLKKYMLLNKKKH